jgi:hypothetical protein
MLRLCMIVVLALMTTAFPAQRQSAQPAIGVHSLPVFSTTNTDLHQARFRTGPVYRPGPVMRPRPPQPVAPRPLPQPPRVMPRPGTGPLAATSRLGMRTQQLARAQQRALFQSIRQRRSMERMRSDQRRTQRVAQDRIARERLRDQREATLQLGLIASRMSAATSSVIARQVASSTGVRMQQSAGQYQGTRITRPASAFCNSPCMRVSRGSDSGSERPSLVGAFSRSARASGPHSTQQLQSATNRYLLRTITDRFTGQMVRPLGRGSTGRTQPRSLAEQLAMRAVMMRPDHGAVTLTRVRLGDARWPSRDGWVKRSVHIGRTEIHYVYNVNTRRYDDFKFVDR